MLEHWLREECEKTKDPAIKKDELYIVENKDILEETVNNYKNQYKSDQPDLRNKMLSIRWKVIRRIHRYM